MKKKHYKEIMARLNRIELSISSLATRGDVTLHELAEIKANVLAIHVEAKIPVKRVPHQ